MRQGHPLGQYWTSGATSQLPSQGGLDPAIGIDLNYFTDATGFSRPMIEHRDNDPLWLDGLTVIRDEKGMDRLVGAFSKIRNYFEGTYSATFSRDGDPTPRYDYNQIMYRLDLSDERLKGAE